MKFFDADTVKTGLVFRSMGGVESRERMGAGFLKKYDRTVDFCNVDYPHYALVYILKGKGVYIDEESGREYKLEAGNYFQRFPGKRHSNMIDPESEWTECFLDIGKKIYSALRSARAIPDSPVGWIDINQPLIERYQRAVDKLKNAEEDELPQTLAYLISLAMDTLGLARKNKEGADAETIIEKACNFLSSNLGERIEIKAFCKENGCGYEKFRKLFFERMGISPGKYRIRRRIDIACQMLNASPQNIETISAELGYSSPYDFSSQFKKYMGVSPSRFRSGK
jgi:AraC-like DNA-binding protein